MIKKEVQCAICWRTVLAELGANPSAALDESMRGNVTNYAHIVKRRLRCSKVGSLSIRWDEHSQYGLEKT